MDVPSGSWKENEAQDTNDSGMELVALLPPALTINDEDSNGQTRPAILKLDGSTDIEEKNDTDSGRCTPLENTISRSCSPSVRFDELLVDVINATTFHVDWCPAVTCSNLHGYKIRYAIRESSSCSEIVVTPGISNYTICGLRPNTEYDVWVNAIDEKENVIHQCGWASQKTDEGEELGRRKSPYVTIIVAAILLTSAVVVPLTVLIVRYISKSQYRVPYLTAITGIVLILVAIVVPLTFLLVQHCDQITVACRNSTSGSGAFNEKGTDNSDVDFHVMMSSFRHRNEWIDVSSKLWSDSPDRAKPTKRGIIKHTVTIAEPTKRGTIKHTVTKRTRNSRNNRFHKQL